jgi:Txe/YoeB family toxin of Txe-Axe toxin-antitoxin module
MATNSVLAKLAVQISANTSEFKKGLDQANRQLKGFNDSIKTIAKVAGISFAADQVIQFGLEVSKLAGQAEAVRNQFDRLPGSVYVMQELRKATGDTVSQFDLMKTAIKAANFGIELSKLPKLLEFATLRAQQTGQSVDYLVESIIMGIGRKSPMILDNLGISLLAIREKLKGVGVEAATVGDFTKIIGDIADESLGNMAAFSENASTKIERLQASWTDLKIAIGDVANESNILGASIDALTISMQIMATDNIDFWDKVKVFINTSIGGATNYAITLAEIIAKNQALANESKKATDNATKTFNELIKKTKDFDAIRQQSTDSLNQDLKEYYHLRIAIKNKIVDEVKQNKQAAFIEKQKSTYAIDYANTIEKLIENLKKPIVSDPEELKKELEKQSKAWDEYYKRITGGAEIAYRNVANLIQEMFAVGLGVSKKESPVLQVPGINPKGGFTDNGGPFGMEDGKLTTPEWLRNYIDQLEEIQNQALKTRDAMIKMRAEAGSSLQDFTEDAIANLAELGGVLAVQNGSFKDFGRGILEAVADFMKLFGQQLIMIGLGKIAFDKLFESIGGGPIALAAGVALIAASGAIKGGIQNRLKKQQEMQYVARNNSGAGTRTYGSNIEVTGRLIGSGRDLVAVIDSTNFDNKYRKGG